jgi:DNA-binding XRE family transcriptional regulator
VTNFISYNFFYTTAPITEQYQQHYLPEYSPAFGANWHMNKIGPQVKRLREQKAMTQEDLTAQCNLLGWRISRGTLAKIESQVRRVIDFEVTYLAQALEVEISDLFDESP